MDQILGLGLMVLRWIVVILRFHCPREELRMYVTDQTNCEHVFYARTRPGQGLRTLIMNDLTVCSLDFSDSKEVS